MRILAVCLGNICRSPTAEAVLRHHLPFAEIDSAGTSDWHIGDAPYPPAIDAAAGRGYDLTTLRARQVTTEDFAAFDLILAMDTKNLETLEAMRPANAHAKVKRLLEYLPDAETREVPDPYYTRDFDGTLDLIEAAVLAMKTDF